MGRQPDSDFCLMQNHPIDVILNYFQALLNRIAVAQDDWMRVSQID